MFRIDRFVASEWRRTAFAAGLGAALLTGFGPPSQGLAASVKPTTEPVSLTESGGPANGRSFLPAISADGRYVAFSSEANNLVFDSNGATDVFVYDRVSGVIERVSVATGGAQANGGSFDPKISADGRFVVFESEASNLVAGDTNNRLDIFVRDRVSGTTVRVSLATGGAQANGDSSDAAISADGRFVAFESEADNLVAGDTNFSQDIFVRDRVSGTTERVSVATGGAQANLFSSEPVISADGRYVAFDSLASNLVAGDTNSRNDVFVRDRFSGTTERVSVAQGGGQGNNESEDAAISGDGRYVAFESEASNLVAGDTNNHQDIFVRDRAAGTTERVSVAQGGGQADSSSFDPAISADGRFVAFWSAASNLVAADTNSADDIFVRDRAAGTTERVSLANGGGQGNNDSVFLPAISADGRYVAFESEASNLVAGDSNALEDIFVRDRTTIAGVQLSVADAQVSEGTPRLGGTVLINSLAFTVSLSAKSRQDVSFRFWTEDVSAKSGTDYQSRVGTATIPAGLTSTIISVPVIADFTTEPNETMHLNIDLPFNATIARGQALGTIFNDDLSFTVGTFELTPTEATIAVGQRLTYELTWTVPSESWRDLNTIELRIGEEGSLLWLLFDETSRTFSLYNPANGEFGPAFGPGSPNVLSSGAAKLYLADSAVIAAGPTSPAVTLLLTVGFEPSAIGEDYPVEVGATSDDGQIQDFDRGATLTIAPRNE